MKLQMKVLLIMVITWLIICVMAITDSKLHIARDYQDLENNIIQHQIQDTQHAFDRMLYTLSLYTLSWAQWDDAYYFMQEKNEKFIKTNFVNAIFRSSELNFIMFFDAEGKLHYGQAYDTHENIVKPIPPALLDYIHNNKSFVTHKSVTSSKVGILQTKLGLIVMSSRPVTLSNGQKPYGSILMGYYLDNSFFETLSQTLGMQVEFFPIASVLKNTTLNEAYKSLSTDNKYTVSVVNSKLMYGYILLKDIDNQSIGLLRIEIPRKIYQEGLWTARHYLAIILLSGIIIIILMGYLLKKFVLDRVLNISKQIQEINVKRKFDSKITVSGHDELSNMVFTINNMLDMISYSQSQLHYLATHDVLTQLPNRDYFYGLLNQAIINAKTNHSKVAIMFLDMDKLKKVNDRYGHAVGDKLIQYAAHRIQSVLRKNDVLGHQSGDEFILFMQEFSDKKAVIDTAKRILRTTSKPFVIDNIKLKISFSIGISIYPTNGRNAEELMKQADDVMYSIKMKSGNDYQCYGDENKVTI